MIIKDPHFLDMVTYDNLCDAVEVMCENNVKVPNITNHIIPKRTKITPFKRGCDFILTSEEKDRLVIAFQGSGAEAKRWRSNFKPDLISNPYFHDGFYDAAKLFNDDIFNAVDNSLIDGKEIVMESYSRGGGISIFSAMDVYKEFKCHIHLTSFGSPRVLGRTYRRKFNKMNIHYDNVRNHRDRVTWIGAPVFKNLGHIKELPVPLSWRFKPVTRHTKYYENIKRLTRS